MGTDRRDESVLPPDRCELLDRLHRTLHDDMQMIAHYDKSLRSQRRRFAPTGGDGPRPIGDGARTICQSTDPRHTRTLDAHSATRSERYRSSSRISVQHWAGWHDGSMWHQEWFDKLEQARKSGAAVSAWVSPDGSPQAVLDKKVRFARLWAAVPLLILFGGVSAIAGYQFVRVLLGMNRR